MLRSAGPKAKSFRETFYYIRNYYKKSKMIAFNSIVVVDSETTGLPHLENNKTKITELALIGCEIKHLKNSKELPRVLHKLVFCFNPMKMIQPESTNVSGLENDLLINIKPFTKTDAEILNHFIRRLPSPVCIIAHNGYKFDFPILQKHLNNLNCRLPDDVYCADSLKAFQDIYPKSRLSLNSTSNTFTEAIYTSEETTKKNSPVINISNSDTSKSAKPKITRTLFSETTLEKKANFVTENKGEFIIQTNFPVGYKLSMIYEFLHGKCYPASHTAEEDCKALLSCIIRCENFFNWMGKKAVIFNSIKPLA